MDAESGKQEEIGRETCLMGEKSEEAEGSELKNCSHFGSVFSILEKHSTNHFRGPHIRQATDDQNGKNRCLGPHCRYPPTIMRHRPSSNFHMFF